VVSFPKNGINKKLGYISPICQQVPHGQICNRFGIEVRVSFW